MYLTLTDSAVIVRYVREKAGQLFLDTIADHELFALSTSVLDTAVNVYLMNINDSSDLAEVPSGSSVIGFSPKTYFERCRDFRRALDLDKQLQCPVRMPVEESEAPEAHRRI